MRDVAIHLFRTPSALPLQLLQPCSYPMYWTGMAPTHVDAHSHIPLGLEG
jgi:hypothetical protein